MERSLESGLKKGMKVEICNSDRPLATGDDDTRDTLYWVATIIMSAGQLLRLRYVGNENDTTLDFWKDMKNVDIQPLGWCAQNGKLLQPHSCILNIAHL